MAQRVGADPDVLPGRRDHQRPDAGQYLRVLDHRRVGPQVTETPAAAPAPDPLRRGIAAHDIRRHAPSLSDTQPHGYRSGARSNTARIRAANAGVVTFVSRVRGETLRGADPRLASMPPVTPCHRTNSC